MSDPMAPFRARFVARAQEDLVILRRARQDQQFGPEVVTTVHRMAGLAGTVGYSEISRIAAEVDDALQAGQAASDGPLDALIAALEALPAQA